MNTILFVEFLEHGGSATALLNFIRYLTTTYPGRFRIVVISSKNSIFSAYENRYGFALHPFPGITTDISDFPHEPSASIKTYLKTFLFILRVVLSERPSLIHSYHYMWSIYTNPIGRLLNIPTLVYLCDVWRPKTALAERLMRSNPKTTYIAVSAYVARQFIRFGLPRSRIVKLFDPIDSARFFEIDENAMKKKYQEKRKTIVYISRVVPERDIEKFIETAAILQVKYPALRFIHHGYHPHSSDRGYYTTLLEMVRTLGLTKAFRFLPYEDDDRTVVSLMQHAFVHIIPARDFALPNIAIQSMMTGTPVIANNTGGNPEIITNGVDGILVPVNSALLYAKAVESLLHDPFRYRSYAMHGIRSSRKKFDAEKNYRKLLDLYRALGLSVY